MRMPSQPVYLPGTEETTITQAPDSGKKGQRNLPLGG